MNAITPPTEAQLLAAGLPSLPALNAIRRGIPNLAALREAYLTDLPAILAICDAVSGAEYLALAERDRKNAQCITALLNGL